MIDKFINEKVNRLCDFGKQKWKKISLKNI